MECYSLPLCLMVDTDCNTYYATDPNSGNIACMLANIRSRGAIEELP